MALLNAEKDNIIVQCAACHGLRRPLLTQPPSGIIKLSTPPPLWAHAWGWRFCFCAELWNCWSFGFENLNLWCLHFDWRTVPPMQELGINCHRFSTQNHEIDLISFAYYRWGRWWKKDPMKSKTYGYNFWPTVYRPNVRSEVRAAKQSKTPYATEVDSVSNR